MSHRIPSVSAVMVLSRSEPLAFFTEFTDASMPPQTMLAWVRTGFRRIVPSITTDKLSGSCNHDIFLCLANLQNCSLLIHVFSISTRGLLQIQDRSPQLRLVASECVCDWFHDATGLDCGDRSWICNTPQLRPFSTNGLILNGNRLCLHQTNWTQFHSFMIITHTCLILILNENRKKWIGLS